MVLCLWVFLMLRKRLIGLNTLYYLRSWLTATYRVILFGSWCIGMLVKLCMYDGLEYCRMDFMLRMVYDKVAFYLHTYLMYIDDLSIALSACHTGCCVSNTIMNHFMYADDLVIFSPSSVGLRALIAVCEQYGISHDIRFNHKKSAIMICRGHYMKNVYPP